MRHDLNGDSQCIVDYAMANGINYFETCYFYLNHECENFVYSLLKPYARSTYEICGKLSMIEAFANDANYKNMYYEQLKRVPQGYFDVYILQTLAPSAYYQIFGTDLIEFFTREKEKGNIIKFGFSEQCHANLLNKFLKTDCWEIAQMPLNYYDWHLCEKDINYKLITEKNIPIIAQAPFKGGLLAQFPEHIKTYLIDYYNRPLDQLAMDFVNDKHPNIILTGCHRMGTLIDCINAHNNYQPIKDEQGILNALDMYKDFVKVPCLMCEKCQQVCPANIPLSLHMTMFNKALYNKKYFESYALQNWIGGFPLHQCTYCGHCVDVCPMKIDIPRKLQDIFELRT